MIVVALVLGLGRDDRLQSAYRPRHDLARRHARSGHAAVAFAGWVAVTFVAANTAYALPIAG